MFPRRKENKHLALWPRIVAGWFPGLFLSTGLGGLSSVCGLPVTRSAFVEKPEANCRPITRIRFTYPYVYDLRVQVYTPQNLLHLAYNL